MNMWGGSLLLISRYFSLYFSLSSVFFLFFEVRCHEGKHLLFLIIWCPCLYDCNVRFKQLRSVILITPSEMVLSFLNSGSPRLPSARGQLMKERLLHLESPPSLLQSAVLSYSKCLTEREYTDQLAHSVLVYEPIRTLFFYEKILGLLSRWNSLISLAANTDMFSLFGVVSIAVTRPPVLV